MLADELRALLPTHSFHYVDEGSTVDSGRLLAKLNKSIKYRFGDEFFELMLEHTDRFDFDTLGAFLKLPFQCCWFEFPKMQMAFLLEQEQSGLKTIRYTSFIRDKTTGYPTPLCSIALSTWPTVTYHCEPSMDSIASQTSTVVACTILLIHCRNRVDIRDVKPQSRLPKGRRQQPKRPLYEHKLVTFQLSGAEKTLCKERKTTTEKLIRDHWVQGHFKRRKNGLFWWNPYIRGNGKIGMITKDYRVQP